VTPGFLPGLGSVILVGKHPFGRRLLVARPVVHWEMWSELSLFEDPDGRVLGLWKQGPKPA
jgi:hypothetical protein